MSAGRQVPAPSDPWSVLRRHTAARVALGRAGTSLPTGPQLDFQLAHARARDAVHYAPDLDLVDRELKAGGDLVIRARSQVNGRLEYLLRPDLGRRLHPDADAMLAGVAGRGSDLVIVLTEGLSGLALQRHGPGLVSRLRPRLAGWRLGPVVLVEGGRVAIGDEVGFRLEALLVLVLLGERPGLSAPDSLGAYLTYGPRPGRTDAERNCVSNIRPEGLPLDDAAGRITWLLNEARRRRLTGVGLKEQGG